MLNATSLPSAGRRSSLNLKPKIFSMAATVWSAVGGFSFVFVNVTETEPSFSPSSIHGCVYEGLSAAVPSVLSCVCGVAAGEGAGVACVAVCAPLVVVGVVEVVGVEVVAVGVGAVVVGVTVADGVAFEVGEGEGKGLATGADEGALSTVPT